MLDTEKKQSALFSICLSFLILFKLNSILFIDEIEKTKSKGRL